jgi:nanoRNase/pAp phosphatase (c-di-AMP/oligoRNAs hydrolase)
MNYSSQAIDASHDGAVPPSRAKIAVVLISERPERFMALRRSALAGRTVYLWVPDGQRAPSWSTPLVGDPARGDTYAPLQGRDTIAIIDLSDADHERRVVRAISRAFPLPSVLVIDHRRTPRHGIVRDGVTWINEGELLADSVELVLRRIAARKRVRGLRRALRGSRSCAFLVQNDPDPDAIASALALRAVLGLRPDRSPIITCGRVTRPENQRLLHELGVEVRHVSRRDLPSFEPLILVDVQPPYFGDALGEVAAVVDHHPVSGEYHARFRDVRTWFGASATMTAEYLVAERDGALSTRLATALLYGIITDTKSLSRSAADEDLEMFAYLFPRADQAMLRRIQHPSYTPLALRRFGQALQRAHVHNGLAYIHLGRLPEDQEHIVAQLAEFCLGMAGADISAVSAVLGPRLVMSTRALSPVARLGERLREQFGSYGSAGGHPVMAKVVINLAAWRADHQYSDDRGLERTVQRALRRALALGPLRRPASARARR